MQQPELATLDYMSKPPRHRRLVAAQEMGLVIVVALMWAILTVVGHVRARNLDPTGAYHIPNLFLNVDSLFEQIATPMSCFAIMAVGMTMVIISGGIDISVGSVMAVSALASGGVLQYVPTNASGVWVLPLALLIGPVVGLICGLINGLLIVGLRIHPFIVTLGTLSVFRGIAINVPQQLMNTSMLPDSSHHLPLAFTDHFMRLKIFGETPMPMIVMLAVVIGGWFYLSKTVHGREIYAVGGNEEASLFSGLQINRVKVRVYAIAGLTAGIAAMVVLGKYTGADTGTADGYELDVIAAAVVGGASLTGGRGTALGAMMGALVLATIRDGISIMEQNQLSKIIIGCAIVVAAAIDRFSEVIRQRRMGARAH